MPESRIAASDCIVLFADLQEGIADLPLTIPAERLKKGVLGLAQLAKLLEIPVVVTAIPPPNGPPRMMGEIEQGLGKTELLMRTTADSFLNPAIAEAVAKSGRKTVLISGVATELAVQLAALTGVDLGYRTFAVVDACGGISVRTEEAALNRILQHGGSTTCVMTLAGELAGDFREEKAQQALAILFAMARQ